MKTISLVMMVKNESAIIRRCLDSVKGVIDYWVICDTGSTDGTKEIRKGVPEGNPGVLHEVPWVDLVITVLSLSSGPRAAPTINWFGRRHDRERSQ